MDQDDRFGVNDDIQEVESEESDAPFVTDDEGNVVDDATNEDDLDKHGFTEEEEGF